MDDSVLVHVPFHRVFYDVYAGGKQQAAVALRRRNAGIRACFYPALVHISREIKAAVIEYDDVPFHRLYNPCQAVL